MFLLIPLRCSVESPRRPIVSAVVLMTITYQTVLAAIAPGVRVPLAELQSREWQDPLLWYQALVSMFQGAGPATLLMLLFFLLVLGTGLEKKVGSLLMAAAFLGGGAASLVLRREGVIVWEEGDWLGRGGMLALVGLAYGRMWEDEVQYFYLIFIFPYIMRAGKSDTLVLFLTMFFHIFLMLAVFPAEVPEAWFSAEGFVPLAWTALMPLAFLTIFLLLAKLGNQIRSRVAEE